MTGEMKRMESKLITITELEYERLKERGERNYMAYVEADEELNKLKRCEYCWHTANGQDWSANGVCRKCCHVCNFKPILAETVILGE